MSSLERIFPGHSELAGRMRALDWSTTELGPPEAWPERLRSAVSICLMSGFPTVMWWGPKMSMLYNDAFISCLGSAKHPAVLARSFAEAWAEIWPTIGAVLEDVRKTGEASASEDTPMFFDRYLPKEEVYLTYSFSPLIGEGNEVDGIFCTCMETTDTLVGTRRIETLRVLGIRALEPRTVDKACQASAEALADNPFDVPFAAIYVVEEGTTRLTLRAWVGLQDSHALPRAVSFASDEPSVWPVAAVLESHRAAVVDLADLGLELPGGPWPEPARKALVLPIPTTAPNRAVLVAGVSPRRVLDAQYRTFFDLIAGQIGNAIANAQTHEGSGIVRSPVPAHQPSERTRAPSTAVPGARILVAEDDTEMREQLTELLAMRWVVEAVPDGEAALATMRKGRFDLILTDVTMPRLDGFGLLKALRADPTYKTIPVIMLSARSGEDSRIQGLESGADDYLVKPFSGREVIARVETHLKLSTRRALAAENAALKRLHEVSARLISEDALPTLLEAVVDAAIAVSFAHTGTVQLYDAATDSLRIVAQRGCHRTFLDYFAIVDADESACSEAVRLHARVIIEDVSRSPIFLNKPSLAVMEAAGVRAVQSTPLVARDGRLLGMFSTHWTEPHRPDDGTLRLLDILARAATDLIEHRQREDALRTSEATVRELRAAESAAAAREIRGYQDRIHQMAVDSIVTEDRERRRIAADLHDGLGQFLALSQIKLTAVRQELKGSPREAIDQVIALIGESIASARTLTFELSPPILYDLGLKEALCWLAEKLHATYETRIEIADDETDKPLDDVTAGLVFRATRELLMNVIKHSRASTAKVSLRRAGDRFAVTVEDTGVGFDPDDPKGRLGGFGLLSVREQIRRLQGSTEVVSSPGQGARIAISVPIRRSDA